MSWQFLLFLLVLFQPCFLSSPSPTSYLCLHDEHSALLQFKQKHYHVSINYSTSLNSWKPNTDCCFWEGISCDSTTGHVVGLALFNSSLNGSIHSNSTLFNLLHLQMLDISWNTFDHFAPSGFERLSGLLHLNLSGNSFSGQFPKNMCQLIQLVSLDLSWNYFQGQIPYEISNLTELVSLDLSTNNFQGQIPSEISNLTKLVSLDLSENYFDGQIPSQISNLTKLVSLDLSWNNFQGQIPSEISNLTKLVSLDLSYSLRSFQLGIPNLRAFVQTSTMLRQLRLDGVNLLSQINRDWCHHLSSALPNLHVLSLIECSLTGPMDASISSFLSLTELYLDFNENLTSTIPSSLMNLTSLIVLGLKDCGFYGDFPSGVFLQPKLSIIDLSYNPLLLVQLPKFSQMNTSLQYLSISQTKFQGILPSSIGNLLFLEELFVDDCNLYGPVPPFISNLTQLTSLSLSDNSLSGQIPDYFFKGRFPNLEALFLGNNLLQGPIHSSLFFLPSIQSLDLSNNQFDGVINEPPPVHNISSSFSRLSLRGNHLKGEDLMRSISKIKGTIEYLDLSLNDFSYLEEDRNLSNDGLPNNNHSGDINFVSAQISYLKLDSCNISEFPRNFLKNQNQLYSLSLSDNRIIKFQDFLKDIKELNALYIGGNRLGGEIPKWIWKKNLRFLNLSNNVITGLELPLPNHSFNMLELLDLHSNMIQECQSSTPCSPQAFDEYDTEVVSHILGSLTSLLSKTAYLFSISNNKLTGKIPISICKVRNFDILDLSKNKLNSSIPTCLGKGNIGVLNLEENKLQGPIPDLFKVECNLHTLKLNKNNFQGGIPRSLGNCKLLTLLDISNNQLNGTFPHWLENLVELQVLVLRSNRFAGPIAQPIQPHSRPFPSLHVVDLSFNNFSGDLPLQYISHWKAMMFDEDTSDLYYNRQNTSAYYQDTIVIIEKGIYLEMQKILTTFTTIDLSNNFFVGKIPDALGNLKALKVLNLSGNSLTGHIPSSMGKLRGLESLDLSRNILFGEIPVQLASLTFLAVLNLSYNDLTGIIPQGSQFNTFSNASYEGNAGLCGFPLTEKCGVLPPTSIFQKGDDDDDDETCLLDWRFALAGYCSGVIIGLVVERELLWRKNRCSKFISRLVVSNQSK